MNASVKGCIMSSALAMKILQSCTEPAILNRQKGIYFHNYEQKHPSSKYISNTRQSSNWDGSKTAVHMHYKLHSLTDLEYHLIKIGHMQWLSPVLSICTILLTIFWECIHEFLYHYKVPVLTYSNPRNGTYTYIPCPPCCILHKSCNPFYEDSSTVGLRS